jgi:hypothetical protein
MEADWEWEVGEGAPVIVADWPGLIDLRRAPERAHELLEAAALPALADALQALNAAASPVWTSKCDFWPSLGPGNFDPDELDAPPGHALHALGCYIDLLARDRSKWTLAPQVEAASRTWCASWKEVPLRGCRVDLVMRRALLSPQVVHFGITAYLTACGQNPNEARDSLGHALRAFALTITRHAGGRLSS